MTNPHTNLCGCYEISIKQMSDELGYAKDAVEKLIRRFSDTHVVLSYNEPTKELLLYNWSKYNWTKSPKFDKALSAEIEKVKFASYKNFLEMRRREDTVSIPYPYPMDTTDTDTDTDYNNNYNNNYSSIDNTKDSDNIQSNTIFDSPDSCESDPVKGIDYTWYQETYNSTCLDLAKVRLMTEGRKRAVRIFHKQFSDEQFAEICKKTASSDFLCCRGSKSAWKASFDFLIKPSNAVKVLEGNYDNRTTESVTDRWN